MTRFSSFSRLFGSISALCLVFLAVPSLRAEMIDWHADSGKASPDVRSSWGKGWEQDGYGYVSYAAVLEPSHGVPATNGTAAIGHPAHLIVASEPPALWIISAGAVCVAACLWRRQKRAA